MGNQQSKYDDELNNREDGPISEEQMKEFLSNTQFSPHDIQHLLLVYKKICGSISDDGVVSEHEFKSNIKFANDKIADKIYKMLDVDGDSNIQFSEFVYGLNIFLPGSDVNTKIEKCFSAYDEDGSGGISKNEVLEIIYMSLDGNTFMNIDKPHLDQLVDDLFEIYDTSGDKEGNMSSLDFKNMVKKAPGILDAFSFDISMLPSIEDLKN